MLNALGAVTGYDRKAFDPERLIAAATEKSGLDDFGGSSFREGLEVLCQSYSCEAHFNVLGRMVAQKRILDVLINRLKIVDWQKRHPEVCEQQIWKPWIVLGLPRSGTTLTSILLDLDSHVRGPLMWEVESPIPPTSLASRYSDERIAQTQRYLEKVYKLMPALPAMHPLEALMPQECIFLTMYDFHSLVFQCLAMSPSYGRWYVNSDMRSAFAMHKTILQIWQNEIATRHWALKAPNHLHAINDLMATYPDARVIWVHRDPVSCVPSITSLLLAMHRSLTKSPDPVAAGDHFNWMYHMGIQRTMNYDDRSSNRTWCYHLHYSALMKDPVASMRGLYEHFGEGLEAEHESRIAAWVRQRPKNVFGRHKYLLEDFGMSKDGIREQYATYTERYGVAFDN